MTYRTIQMRRIALTRSHWCAPNEDGKASSGNSPELQLRVMRAWTSKVPRRTEGALSSLTGLARATRRQPRAKALGYSQESGELPCGEARCYQPEKPRQATVHAVSATAYHSPATFRRS